MSEWREFGRELRSPKSDVAVLLTTFGLTVFVDLTVAIGVGMVLAAFLFIRRMAGLTTVTNVAHVLGTPDDDDVDAESDKIAYSASARRDIPDGVEMYEVMGPFFFGAAATFRETIARVSGKPRVLIIRMRDVLALDSTGMRALRDVASGARKAGTTVILSDVHMQPLVARTGSPTMSEIGTENVFGNVEDALRRARELTGS